MGESGFPNLQTFYEYFSDRIEANDRARFRYLASIGSAVTTSGILVWYLLNILENASSFWNLPAFLSLVVLVYLTVRYANSLFPSGIEGFLEGLTERGNVEVEERLTLLTAKENLPRLREVNVLIQLRDMLLSAVPLLVTFFIVWPVPGVGDELALSIGFFRLSLGLLWIGLSLWFLKPHVLDAVMSSLDEVGRLIDRFPHLLMFTFKLWRLQQVVGAIVRTIFYGLQIAGVFVLVLLFGEQDWIAIRLALALLGLSFLGWFTFFIWKHIERLQEETEAWREMRVNILFGQYGTTQQVRSGIREAMEEISLARVFPYRVPQEVLDATLGLPSGGDGDTDT
ncbi:MAG: hypothetical protein V3U52_02515 [Thermoplasmata archaeon]